MSSIISNKVAGVHWNSFFFQSGSPYYYRHVKIKSACTFSYYFIPNKVQSFWEIDIDIIQKIVPINIPTYYMRFFHRHYIYTLPIYLLHSNFYCISFIFVYGCDDAWLWYFSSSILAHSLNWLYGNKSLQLLLDKNWRKNSPTMRRFLEF